MNNIYCFMININMFFYVFVLCKVILTRKTNSTNQQGQKQRTKQTRSFRGQGRGMRSRQTDLLFDICPKALLRWYPCITGYSHHLWNVKAYTYRSFRKSGNRMAGVLRFHLTRIASAYLDGVLVEQPLVGTRHNHTAKSHPSHLYRLPTTNP